MKDNLLDIRSLTLQIVGKSLCKNLDLAISHNQHWGLLGKNGVGKTSLLHCLMGLREIDAGSILLHGKPIIPVVDLYNPVISIKTTSRTQFGADLHRSASYFCLQSDQSIHRSDWG